MEHFLEIAKRKGFRLTHGSLNFSTMSSMRARFEDDKGNFFIWGLNEYKKPATLCYPRPNVYIKKIIDNEICFLTSINDDAINHLLKEVNHIEIFDSIFLNKKSFSFDLTKNPTD